MEEILASIRRIIEDSDTVRKQAPESALRREAQQTAGTAARPGLERETIAVEAFRLDHGAPLKPPAAPAPTGGAAELLTQRLQQAAARPPSAPDTPAAPTAAARPQAAATSPEAKEPASTAAALRRDGNRGEPAPILSEPAGRQVAAAFDELSEAFAENRRKSFDEMAEEMLRPMLQEWLDNNLPRWSSGWCARRSSGSRAGPATARRGVHLPERTVLGRGVGCAPRRVDLLIVLPIYTGQQIPTCADHPHA